jgi:hypothetical protein
MRTLPWLALLVGCGGGGGGGGGDDGAPGDAKRMDAAVDITELSGDFTCAGMPWPATATDPISVTGRVTNPVAMTNVGGAAVEIHKTAGDTVLVMGTAATNGVYAMNVPTGGTAPAIYRKATLAGHVDAYTFDPYAPWDGNHSGRDIYSLTTADRATYYTAAGLTPDPAKSTVLVEVLDCIPFTVYGATIDAPGAERIVYFDDSGQPSATTTATGAFGTAVVLNAPAGTLDITVHAGSVIYRARPIASRANSFAYSPRLP